MKIKTNLIHRKGRKVSFGKEVVEFDNEGVAEVAPELAEIILAQDNSLSVFDESGAQKSDTDVEVFNKQEEENIAPKEDINLGENKADSDLGNDAISEDYQSESPAEVLEAIEKNEEATQEVEETQEDEAYSEDDLANMTVKELQSIAKEAELPNSEWATLKKDQLIVYLSSKLSE